MTTLPTWLQWVSSTYYLHTGTAQGPEVKWEPIDGAISAHGRGLYSKLSWPQQPEETGLMLKVELSALHWTRAAELASAPSWQL